MTNRFSAKTIILCDGSFPEHEIPLSYLKNATEIICCDGAADKLIAYNLEPTFIVGDLDSVSESTKTNYKNCLVFNADQETNDQTKAVEFAISRGVKNLIILGATGKREDHTLGNISLLLDYCEKVEVISVSNSGIFTPMIQSTEFESFTGQQVSIFSVGNPSFVSSQNLKFPLNHSLLNSWWMGTLNECLGSKFSLNFTNGRFIVFQKFA